MSSIAMITYLPVIYCGYLHVVYYGYLQSTLATCGLLWLLVVYYDYTYIRVVSLQYCLGFYTQLYSTILA